MSITRHQAGDLLAENWGGYLSWDDPEWWDEMCDWLMEYPSVKALRRKHPDLRIPHWWPGAEGTEATVTVKPRRYEARDTGSHRANTEEPR